jgi:hypothetical protein
MPQGDAGYGIRLPHNSLLVMWPPCQEDWKHEVLLCCIDRHAAYCGDVTLKLKGLLENRAVDWLAGPSRENLPRAPNQRRRPRKPHLPVQAARLRY